MPHPSCEGLYFLVEVKGLLTLGKKIYFFNYDYCKWASQRECTVGSNIPSSLWGGGHVVGGGAVSASGAIQPMDHLPWPRKKGVVLLGCVSHPIPGREKPSPRRVPE